MNIQIEAIYGCDNCGSPMHVGEMLCDTCLIKSLTSNIKQVKQADYLSADIKAKLLSDYQGRLGKILARQ